jgi:F-type H+-transporting ATPase subunit a
MNNHPTETTLSLGEKITAAISIRTVFTIDAFGVSIPISETVLWTWIIMVLLIALSLAATRNMREVPRGAQLAAETAVEFFENFVTSVAGPAGSRFVPFLGTLALYLCVANLIPMLTPVGGFGFEPLFEIKPIMRDINITAALAVTVIVAVLFSSIVTRGLGGWFRSLFKPVAFMLPFNILEYAIRPVSLALRLFGNILGAFIIMRLIEAMVPVGIPPLAGLYFDLFDGVLQTVVFVYLSTIFLAESIHMEEHHG